MAHQSRKLQAVIFDFDGVIVDSEPLHYRAFQDVLEDFGLCFSFSEYMEHYIGFDDRDAFREVFSRAGKTLYDDQLEGLIRAKAIAFERIVGQGIRPFYGVNRIIGELGRARIPLGVASGALKSEIIMILERISLKGVFLTIVAADEVKKSKPHPETYQKVVGELERCLGSVLNPRNCVALEDTPAGIKSAQSAGLRVVGVAHSYKADELKGADYVVESLADLTVNDLEKVVGR